MTASTAPRSTPGVRRALALVTALLLALTLSACGNDDGATVTELGSGDSGSGSGSGSAPSSGSGSAPSSGSGSGTGAADGSCPAADTELEDEVAAEIELTATDYAYDPAELEVEAGVVEVYLTNEGEEDHELAFLPGGGDVPFTEDGAPDEAALEEAGAFELEAFAPGQTCEAFYELEAGSYTLFCLVEDDEGVTHYELGMRGTLEVS